MTERRCTGQRQLAGSLIRPPLEASGVLGAGVPACVPRSREDR